MKNIHMKIEIHKDFKFLYSGSVNIIYEGFLFPLSQTKKKKNPSMIQYNMKEGVADFSLCSTQYLLLRGYGGDEQLAGTPSIGFALTIKNSKFATAAVNYSV